MSSAIMRMMLGLPSFAEASEDKAAANDEARAGQNETTSTAKRVLLRRSERSEAMTNDEIASSSVFMAMSRENDAEGQIVQLYRGAETDTPLELDVKHARRCTEIRP